MDKDVVHIYTIEYCSATEKNKITPFAATQKDTEVIILSGVRKRKTNTM